MSQRRPTKSIPTSPTGTSATYTAEQRRQLQQGLRILARMIVRVHLRREMARAASEQPETPTLDGETGD